jgi:hypothetical protein
MADEYGQNVQLVDEHGNPIGHHTEHHHHSENPFGSSEEHTYTTEIHTKEGYPQEISGIRNTDTRHHDTMALETNYPIPYRSKLTEPFEPGQTLIVRGKTAEDSVRFTVNLHTASADFSGNDVPLHISIRFDEGKIVFNTFSKGEWGKEERKSNPWKRGDDIDIRIRAHDSKFQIFADQKEIKEYEHRVPLSSISHFSIDGDVFITHIHWGGRYYPVPYESGIPGEGIAPGKTLVIYGTPEKKGKRFHINLLKKNGDIALHFNPRFDEKAIVRNSLLSNEWGNEEREGKMVLEKATGFDLEIHNEAYGFQIFLNGERFATYAHRTEPNDLHGIQIGGDVEITGIQIVDSAPHHA